MHLEDSIIDLDLAVDVTRLLVNPKRELLPVLTALKEWKTVGEQDNAVCSGVKVHKHKPLTLQAKFAGKASGYQYHSDLWRTHEFNLSLPLPAYQEGGRVYTLELFSVCYSFPAI